MALAFEASKVKTDRWYSHRPPEIDISEFSRLDAKDNELSLSAVPIHGILWFDVVPVMLGPNITGGIELSHLSASGATGSITLTRGGSANYGTSVGSRTVNMGIDASLSSYVYGTVSTVQPKSLLLSPCIKF